MRPKAEIMKQLKMKKMIKNANAMQ